MRADIHAQADNECTGPHARSRRHTQWHEASPASGTQAGVAVSEPGLCMNTIAHACAAFEFGQRLIPYVRPGPFSQVSPLMRQRRPPRLSVTPHPTWRGVRSQFQ